MLLAILHSGFPSLDWTEESNLFDSGSTDWLMSVTEKTWGMGCGEKENTNLQELKSMHIHLTTEYLLFYVSFSYQVGNIWIDNAAQTCKTLSHTTEKAGSLWAFSPRLPYLPGAGSSTSAPLMELSVSSVSFLALTTNYNDLFIRLPALTLLLEHEFHKGSDHVQFLTYCLLTR